MASRIGNHIEFPNYSADELVEIGKVMCRELEYELGPDAEPALRAYMAKRMTMPFFANARTVRRAPIYPFACPPPGRCGLGTGLGRTRAQRAGCTGSGALARVGRRRRAVLHARGGRCSVAQGLAAQGVAAQGVAAQGHAWHGLRSRRHDAAPPRAMADPSPYPSPHLHPWQIRNAIDLGRMRAAIRVFNEKTAPGSDGMVEAWELQTLQGCDFPTVEELEASEETQGLAF